MRDEQWGVHGWRPDWRPGHEQLQRHGGALGRLVGATIVETWLVWIEDRDEWFADLPVVLVVEDDSGRRQLELCWQRADDLSLTWDGVRLERQPGRWGDWTLGWRRAGHPALARAEGAVITEVAEVRHRLDDPSSLDRLLRRQGSWDTHGLWLGTDRGGLHVFDALDENGLDGTRPATMRRTSVMPVA